jgi:hypothetical protein
MRSREPYHCWGNRCQGVIVVARLRKLSGSRQSNTDCRLTHTSTDCGRVVARPPLCRIFAQINQPSQELSKGRVGGKNEAAGAAVAAVAAFEEVWSPG